MMTLQQSQIDDHAEQVLTRIREMQIDNELPQDITRFAQLHDHFDANVGWGDATDKLPADDWIDVQHRVDALLQQGWPLPDDTPATTAE
jgi:hypothetical protein